MPQSDARSCTATRRYDGGVTLTFTGARPPTANASRARSEWWADAATTRDFREVAWSAVLAHQPRIGPLGAGPFEVVAYPTHANHRSPQDVGACHPAVKAMVDGVVDAKLIPGDSPRFVHRLIYEHPRVEGVNGLVVTVRACRCDLCRDPP